MLSGSCDGQGALALAVEALMWEESEVGPAVRAAVGRLANALVAVLGPELSPGSAAYSRTKSLVRGMQVALRPGEGPGGIGPPKWGPYHQTSLI